jgi:hypothetical protein
MDGGSPADVYKYNRHLKHSERNSCYPMFVCCAVRLFPLALIRVWTFCLIANPQQVLPLTEVAFESHAFGNLKA